MTELQSAESDCWAFSFTVVVRGRIYEKEKGRASQGYFREYFREKGGDGDNRTHGRDSNKPWNEVLIILATTSIQDAGADEQ